jgi:hypothetical protein
LTQLHDHAVVKWRMLLAEPTLRCCGRGRHVVNLSPK